MVSYVRNLLLPLSLLLFGMGMAHAQYVKDNGIAIQAAPTVNGLQLTWQASSYAGIMTRQELHRRRDGRGPWQPLAAPLATTAVSFNDADVEPGERFEYRVTRWFGDLPHYSFGYLMAGEDVMLPRLRGRLLLVIESSLAALLPDEIPTLIEDFRGDGWEVTRLDLPASLTPTQARAQIAASWAADPKNTNTLLLLGHIPVPYAGRIAPDGHDTHLGAWPADGYLADMDGLWSDDDAENTASTNPANWNFPGDGKWDEGWFDGNRRPEMTWGRIDFSDLPGAPDNEVELTRRYLNRLHAWKHRFPPFNNLPTGALIDDHLGFFWGESFAGSAWRGFTAITGAAGCDDGEWLNDLAISPKLLAYGSGPGNFQSAGGVLESSDAYTTPVKAVFQFLFGSGFGDWDNSDNLLRASLAGPDGSLGLACAWAGVPQWQFHLLGGGATLGDCLFTAATDSGDPADGYQAGQLPRSAHLGLMGDPTLRLYPIGAPQGLTATPGAGSVTISWSAASVPGLVGYWVDRAPSLSGPFIALNHQPVTGTSFVDRGLAAGESAVYRVRSVARVFHPGGSLLVPSQGAFVTAPPIANSPGPRLAVFAGAQPLLPGNNVPPPGGTGLTSGHPYLRLTLVNRGSQPLVLTAPPSLSGAGANSFSIVAAPTANLPAGGSTEWLIAYQPAAAGRQSAVLTISCNDPAGPLQQISLTGEAFATAPENFPAIPTLALAPAAQTTREILLRNPGNFPIDYQLENPFTRARIISSAEAGGPAHQWVDIRTTGQAVVFFPDADEGLSAPVNLGFTYPWNGGSTNQVRVCTNGYLVLDGEYPITRLAPRFPNPASAAAVVAGFWLDMLVANGATVHTLSSPSEFIIQFTDFPAWTDPENTVTFQISLYPDGRVRWRYQQVGIPTSEAVLGWQAGFSGVSLPMSPVGGRTYELRPPNLAAWGLWNTTTGTLAPGGETVVSMAVNATGLPNGPRRELFTILWGPAGTSKEFRSSFPMGLAIGPGTTQSTAWWAAATNLTGQSLNWQADSDFDTFPNGIEYALGTHPQNPMSRPRIGLDPQAFSFRRVDDLTDVQLAVESSTNLKPPWVVGALASGTGALVSTGAPVLQDSGPGPARDVRVSPPPPPAFLRLRARPLP